MITVSCQPSNLAFYGMDHFARTYGIPALTNRFLAYPSKEEFLIEIKKDGIDLIYDKINLEEYTKYCENKIVLEFDIFKLIGQALTGRLEKCSGFRELTTPLVDALESEFFRLMMHACRETKTPLLKKAFWPKGRFAVCLTHDVDEIRKTYQYLTRFLRNLRRLEVKNALYHLKSFFTDKIHGRNPYWTFEEIMELEDKLGVRSTFFFLKETARVNPLKPSTWKHYARRYNFSEVEEVIQKLSSSGWEVGLHGSYNSFTSEEMLEEEKISLEKVLRKKVKGIRQHHLNLKFPDTWIFQEKVGLEYDTSLGFKEKIGFRWYTCFPFFPLTDKGTLSIIEIPLAIMDICLIPEKDWKKCVDVVEEVERYGGVLTLLWHHTVFNEEEYPSWKRFYAKLIKFAAKKDAWITNGIEIANWWKKRDRTKINFTFDERKLKINSDKKVPLIIYLPDDEVEIEANVNFTKMIL